MYASRLLAVHDTRRRDDLRGLGRTASAGNLVNGWSHIKSRGAEVTERRPRRHAAGDACSSRLDRWRGEKSCLFARWPSCPHRTAGTPGVAPTCSWPSARATSSASSVPVPRQTRTPAHRRRAGSAAGAAAGPQRRQEAPVVLAATHDGELVELTSGTFDAYHFGDSIGPDGLMFDHRLQRGPASTRNAIALLRLHGAPETLLAQAVTTAQMLDRQRGTTLVGR